MNGDGLFLINFWNNCNKFLKLENYKKLINFYIIFDKINDNNLY